LPLHVARKKIAHVGPDGVRVEPTTPNGVKLELFIFDTFPHALRMAALEVAREDEFAPVKNAPGAESDSPDTARAAVYALSTRHLLAAGGGLEVSACDVDGSAELEVSAPEIEISPLLSYAGEGLRMRAQGKSFKSGTHLERE